MKTQDIRWVQRFDNYQKALRNLSEAVELSTQRDLSKLEKQGLIQAFEYTYELAWKTIKDFFESQGEVDITGSRDAFRLAFSRGLIKNGDILMETVKSRQLTTHTYNEETADKIFYDVKNKYYNAFNELLESLLKQKKTRKL